MVAITMRFNIAIVGWGAKEEKKYCKVIMICLMGDEDVCMHVW